MTDRQKAFDNWNTLRTNGVSDEQILEHLLGNWMSGSDALQATEDLLHDRDLDDSDEDSDDE